MPSKDTNRRVMKYTVQNRSKSGAKTAIEIEKAQ
jgi:hypothetical protein